MNLSTRDRYNLLYVVPIRDDDRYMNKANKEATMNQARLYETVFCPGGQVMPSLPQNAGRDVPAENGLAWLAWSGETFIGFYATKAQALSAVAS